MYVIRPITENDLDTLEKFARSTSLGMISMPRKRPLLEEKIHQSLRAFGSEIREPKREIYLFILEDSLTQKAGGSCGIYSKTGPLYYFSIEPHNEQKMLRPVAYPEGPSELCGLFLSKEFRHGGLGRLLSLSRLLFIASYPDRFDKSIMAQLRGYIKKDESSPFWDGIGKHFLPISFPEALERQEEGKEFIPEFLPEYPLYISLLPQKTQKAIGAVYETTKPAFKMLTDEGFRYTEEVDVFDGGPRLLADQESIRTIRQSRVSKVESIQNEEITSGCSMLVSNTRLDFRCCIAKVKDGIALDETTARALQIDIGEDVRYIPLQEKGAK